MQCFTQVCVFLILRLYFIFVIQSKILHTLNGIYYIYISLILFLLSIHEICMAFIFFSRSALFFLLLLHMGLYISLIHLIHD